MKTPQIALHFALSPASLIQSISRSYCFSRKHSESGPLLTVSPSVTVVRVTISSCVDYSSSFPAGLPASGPALVSPPSSRKLPEWSSDLDHIFFSPT